MSGRSVLVLGGARSGKSIYAENLAQKAAGKLVYIATAEGRDGEMQERIAAHQARRGAQWRTVEAPLDICKGLDEAGTDTVLLDCVTLWVSNLLEAEKNVEAEVQRFCDRLAGLEGETIIVSNEVGLGIVPDNALARKFRDEAGRANQMIAEACDRVVFVAAGQALVMKDESGSR